MQNIDTPPQAANGRHPTPAIPPFPAPAIPPFPALAIPPFPALAIPPFPAPGTDPKNAEHDLKTRNRNERGDRLPWTYTYSIPTIEDMPLEKTPLARALGVIEAVMPGRAATLHHFYNGKLLDALHRFQKVRAEEEAAAADRDAYAVRTNAAIDEHQAELTQQRDAATQADRMALAVLEDQLGAAHADAAEKVAKTGGTYDATSPNDDCVLRHAPMTEEVAAARQRLPGPHGDAHGHIMPAIGWFLTIVVGALIGVSLGIICHLLHASSLGRHWPTTLFCIVAGVGFSIGIKYAVRGLWYLIGQDYYLGVLTPKWRFIFWTALLVTLALLMFDASVERQGLLALAQLQSETAAVSQPGAPASAPPLIETLVPWFVALLVTLGYLVCAGFEGYLKGRQKEVLAQVRAYRDSEFAGTDTAVRADPVNQVALHAIAHVRELLRRHAAVASRIAETAAPFEAQIAALEQGRLSERLPLNEEARKRIQDALDNLHGAQGVFDAMFEEALSACEAHSSFWRRLLDLFLGYRPPRRSRRETSQRHR